ncbi:hypothetical protein GGR58DRAFT_345704 [Xylaria digitata]|nr:hypothetical protein GGR58DRAFT_345704 [Xylaria digitata]
MPVFEALSCIFHRSLATLTCPFPEPQAYPGDSGFFFLDRLTLFLISGTRQSWAIFLSPPRPASTTRFLLVRLPLAALTVGDSRTRIDSSPAATQAPFVAHDTRSATLIPHKTRVSETCEIRVAGDLLFVCCFDPVSCSTQRLTKHVFLKVASFPASCVGTGRRPSPCSSSGLITSIFASIERLDD